MQRMAGVVAWLTLLLAAFVPGSAAATGTPPHRYVVNVDEELSTFRIKACFDDEMPDELVVALPRASEFLADARIETPLGPRRPENGRSSIDLRELPEDGCLSYRVDIGAAARSGADPRTRLVGTDLVASPGLWFWRPRRFPEGSEIEFRLPPDMAVSAPWRARARSPGRVTFVLDRTPFQWPGQVAVGRFQLRQISLNDAELNLAMLDGSPPASFPDIRTWLLEAAGAVTRAYGRFPVPRIQLLILPIGPAAEAIPWAQIQRGGGATGLFLVDQNRPLEEFRSDWTATHELSHLLLPFVKRRDAWLSEGLATWYQNVLRARAGMLSERQAWQKITDGFQKGRDDHRGTTLREATRQMHRDRAYRQVYWSGAAIAMLADVRLRRKQQAMSLDRTLQRLQECCLPSHRSWSARELCARLDELSDSKVFTDLLETHIRSPAFPDVGEILSSLGVESRDGRVVLVESAPEARIRKAIMSPLP